MTGLWKSIEARLAEIAPAILSSPNPGVTDEAVAELETLIGASLPADFVAFYQVHDGQSDGSTRLIYWEELMSFERIADQSTFLSRLIEDGTFQYEGDPLTSTPEAGIKESWWNPLWLPITCNGAGDHYCLDLDPAEGGNRGQVIRFTHDHPGRELEAPSSREWIARYAEDLHNGDLVYDESSRGIIVKEWPGAHKGRPLWAPGATQVPNTPASLPASQTPPPGTREGRPCNEGQLVGRPAPACPHGYL